MAEKGTGTGCDASSRSLMRIKKSGSVVIDVGSCTTKVVVPDDAKAEMTTVPTIVHGIRKEYDDDCYFAVGRSWCSSRGWFILRPFKDLAAFKNHFDAGVFFLVEIMRSHVLKSAGLLNGLKRRREIAVALPTWLMADMELALKFYGEVSKSLKRYSITFVDPRVALAAYMNKRFVKEHDFCKMSTRAASK